MSAKSLRICLWSGPRNVSTALMYSFAQRSDTAVVDEPLYGHYLRVSGARHPGRAEVLASMDTDGDRVMRLLIGDAPPKPVLFMKHMAHHLTQVGDGFLALTAHVLLIRDPRDMLTSLTRQLPDAKLADTGLERQCRLLAQLRSLGQAPPVIDAQRLLGDPARILATLCSRLGLAFEPAMLHWPAGPKPYDGVWARHWYDNVHRSTGFESRPRSRDALPERLLPLLTECRPHYDELFACAI
jgi:hypothetical protein